MLYENMKIQSIQVLGSGCPTCQQLFEQTKRVADELNINIEVEYITDITKIVEMGIMTSPVLVINNKAVLIGGGKSDEEIKKVLEDSTK